LLVIDQFEEIFTLVGDDRQSEREAFCSNLVNLVSAPVANHKVIITMRGDKKGQLLKFPALLKLFRSSLIEVAELDSGELREAILEPADQVGLKFEEGIVDALVKEIIGEPAGLPLLQFTLLKLWDTREHSRVTWEGYRRLGGARKALGRSADELYTGLIPAEQVVAKRLILRLVRAGIGLEGDRNRVLRGSLLSLGNTDVVERVLDKLAEASLIRVVRVSNEGASPEDQIEVAHEALIRHWEALAGWLQDEQVAIRKRERLTQLADNWRARGEQRDDLLRGSLLYEAQAYSKEHPEDLNEFEKYFVRISGEEVELATKRQITEANKRAEENAQLAIEKARWARTLNLALLGLSVLTMLILVVAIVAWRLVDAKYRRSHASELSYKAIEVVNRNQAGGDYSPPGTIRAPLGLSLALKSVYVSYSQNRYLPNWGGKPGDDVPADSRWALDMATLAAAPKLSVADATYRPTSILFSSSGALAIAAGADGSLKVWEPAKEVPKTLEELGRPTQQSPVDATVYYSQHSFADPANRPPSPQCDPAHGDTPSLGRGLSFFDARALKAPTILVSEYATMRTAVSVHGDYLLSAGLDSRGTGAATIWKLRSGTGCRLRDLKLGSPVTAVAFASASDTLAIGNGNGLIELWKVEDEHNKTDFRPTSAPKKEQSDSGVQSIAFSPDDKFLVASFFDGTITVREVASGTEKFSRIQKPAIASVVFSPDKEHFVTTSLDGQFEIWSLDGSEPIHFAEHDHSEVPLVAFGSENATRFVSVWGTFATVWEKSGDNKWSELPNADRQVSLDPITAVSMSADGTQLLTADRDGFVGTHDLILDAAIKRAWKLNPQPLTTQQCNDMVGEPRQGECNDFYYDATYHKGVGSARDNARAVSHP
jgi:WD40 repeat protein